MHTAPIAPDSSLLQQTLDQAFNIFASQTKTTRCLRVAHAHIDERVALQRRQNPASSSAFIGRGPAVMVGAATGRSGAVITNTALAAGGRANAGTAVLSSPAAGSTASGAGKSKAGDTLETDVQVKPMSKECVEKDTKYEPLDMSGTKGTLEKSMEHCQARCRATDGCAHFSFKRKDVKKTLKEKMNPFYKAINCHLEDRLASSTWGGRKYDAGPAKCKEKRLVGDGPKPTGLICGYGAESSSEEVVCGIPTYKKSSSEEMFILPLYKAKKLLGDGKERSLDTESQAEEVTRRLTQSALDFIQDKVVNAPPEGNTSETPLYYPVYQGRVPLWLAPPLICAGDVHDVDKTSCPRHVEFREFL
eukprot:TRINITY_DN27784_c0_g1_i1.p1 TRINITY_DN27784_c0_g1~~TRINITY_DN27784_c0_g1_i1.p1  ORF type:complete len:361 (+),score=60.61 TRINITY_DN27784_c0_g1_i1:169-1251(+)